MKGKRYTTEEKIRTLREADGGKAIIDICREKNLSEVTFHRWKRQFGHMELNEARRLKELERKTLLQRAGKGEESYRQLVEGRLKDGERELPWGELKAGIALGTRAFADKLRKGLVIGRETEGKRFLRRRLTFDEVRQAAEVVKGEKWADFADRHGDSGQALVYKAARDYAGMTMAEIGAECDGADYAAMGMAIRRLECKLKLKQDKALSRQWHLVLGKLEDQL